MSNWDDSKPPDGPDEPHEWGDTGANTDPLASAASGPGTGTLSAAAPSARLVGVLGADQGREFPLGAHATVGRGDTCHIVLADTSVSRKHAEIAQAKGAYTLSDLGSANGTFVNGQKITRLTLQSGDEVGFGSAVFKFVAGDDAFKPVAASSRRQESSGATRVVAQTLRAHPILAVVACVVIMLLVGVGSAMFNILRMPIGPDSDAAFKHRVAGMQALNAARFKDASTQFELWQRRSPKSIPAKRYVRAVAGIQRARQRVDAALRMPVERLNLVEAQSILTQAPRGLPAEPTLQLFSAFQESIDARIARAQAALEAGQRDAARALLKDVVVVAPWRTDVKAMVRRLDATPTR